MEIGDESVLEKQFFVVLILITMLFGSINVFAEKNILYYEDVREFPPTYIQSEICLMGEDESLAERLVNAWSNLETEIDISDLNIYLNDISDAGDDLYSKILFDNPLLYYVSRNFYYAYYPNGRIATILPVYTVEDKAEIRETLEAIGHATADILLNVNDSMDDFQKVMAVHDYMVFHYEYDTSLEENTIKIMTEKIGVCQSYALAFKHVMNTIGIDCTFVPSDAMRHAWNLVKIDGRWYHIDVTWDDPVTDRFAQVFHEYALYSSDAFQSHQNPHYGFDVGDLANSSIYDDAPWRDAAAGIASWGGHAYWIQDKQLVRDDGKLIYDKLDEGNGWTLNGTTFSVLYTGLSVYDGCLYFNTDAGIYVYDIVRDTTQLFAEEKEICGLFVDKHQLRFNKGSAMVIGNNEYDIKFNEVKEGIELKKKETPIEVSTIHKDDKVIISVNNETEKPMMILSFGKKGGHVAEIPAGDTSSVTFEAEEEQTLFFWDFNMRPIRKPVIIHK